MKFDEIADDLGSAQGRIAELGNNIREIRSDLQFVYGDISHLIDRMKYYKEACPREELERIAALVRRIEERL